MNITEEYHFLRDALGTSTGSCEISGGLDSAIRLLWFEERLTMCEVIMNEFNFELPNEEEHHQ